jgi:hypothetical protein
MSNDLICDFVYHEKGSKLSRQLKIGFVSNYMRREITQYFVDAQNVKMNWDKINDIISEISSHNIEKPENYKSEIAQLETVKEELTSEIMKHNNSGLIDKNVTLLIDLLKDNGYKDEKLFDLNFWDRCVEINEIITILAKALSKDVDKKKVNN